MLEVIQHPDVREEILQAAAYLAEHSEGLMLRFLQEVDNAVEEIQTNPTAWPEVEDGVRRRQLHVFPYGVLYSVHPSRIFVLAVMHLHRRPGYWKERVSEGQ